MDLTRAHYELLFERRCRDVGDGFQSFFSTLMELRYPRGDFVRVRPWGPAGDRKNDGYLRSRRQLFQCFGPREMRPLAPVLKKIRLDFKGALPHWRKHFDVWIFVHNGIDGTPADVLKVLLELSEKHKPLVATAWGYPELLAELRQLSDADLEYLLGPALDRRAMLDVRVESVRSLLSQVAEAPAVRDVDVRPVPPKKLEFNQLSDAAATLLLAGMSRADVVRKYLQGSSDQTRYDKLAGAFRARYVELREQGLSPDDIFHGLQQIIVGDSLVRPSHQAAMYAILAFFFESCEIFERPSVEVPV